MDSAFRPRLGIDSAFRPCQNSLARVTIRNSMTQIGGRAFAAHCNGRPRGRRRTPSGAEQSSVRPNATLRRRRCPCTPYFAFQALAPGGEVRRDRPEAREGGRGSFEPTKCYKHQTDQTNSSVCDFWSTSFIVLRVYPLVVLVVGSVCPKAGGTPSAFS